MEDRVLPMECSACLTMTFYHLHRTLRSTSRCRDANLSLFSLCVGCFDPPDRNDVSAYRALLLVPSCRRFLSGLKCELGVGVCFVV